MNTSFLPPYAPASALCGERSLEIPQAWDLGCATALELGVEPTFQVLGEDPAPSRNPGATRCRLHHPDGRTTEWMTGCGKGHPDVARVGALYEALEHYLTGRDGFRPEDLVMRSAHQVAAAPDVCADAAIALLAEGPDEPLPCRSYQSLPDGREIIVPLVLSAPWYAEKQHRELRRRLSDAYDYRALGRYALNNGCAIGADRDEAAVHGINEVIERDALSVFLIRNFFMSGSRPTVFDRASLPVDLFDMLEYTESVIGVRISLFDMTTDLAVPSVLAYAPPGPSGFARRGSGTSLSPRHAVYRAIGELLQGALGTATIPDYEPPSLDAMLDHPKLHRCAAMDLTEHIQRAHTVDLVDRPVPAEPGSHLAQLVDLLAERGYTPYLSHYRALSTGVAAVHVYIPGMERFMAVVLGNLVVPGPRGLAVLRSGAPASGRSASSATCGEHGLPLTDAWNLAMGAVDAFGLVANVDDLGGDPGEAGAWKCRLSFASDGATNAHMTGGGKGHAPIARVGALYEALESYLMGPDRFPYESAVTVPAHDVANAEALRADSTAALLAEGPDVPMACLRYRALRGGSTILAPVFLAAPWYTDDDHRERRHGLGDEFDYQPVRRHCLSNGGAVGASPAEAVVHGLNEVIERDALSLFLIRAFFDDRAPLTSIDPASLPEDLARLLAYAQRLVGTTVTLFDITTDLGVPSVFAYAPPAADGAVPTRSRRRDWPARGSGTSVSFGHAVYRALSELVQAALSLGSMPDYRPPSFEHMDAYPRLRRCAGLELELAEQMARVQRVDFAAGSFPDRPEAHLELLVDTLESSGYPPYATPFDAAPPGISAAHVFVPGLERFMVVQLGRIVAPGRRGLDALSAERRGPAPRTRRETAALDRDFEGEGG